MATIDGLENFITNCSALNVRSNRTICEMCILTILAKMTDNDVTLTNVPRESTYLLPRSVLCLDLFVVVSLSVSSHIKAILCDGTKEKSQHGTANIK